MLFSSAVFLFLFLPAVMILYKIGGKHLKYKNAILLIASLVFYAYGEPVFVFVLTASIIVNYILGLMIEKNRSHKRLYLVSAVVFNIGLLFIFKYLTFILTNLSLIMEIDVVKITLPIGISFYTFQILSYVIDVYREKVDAQKNLFSLALYVSMFPQLVAGPIVRYSSIEKEIDNRTETWGEFSKGCSRFVVGLSKKVLIADFMGQIADGVFGTVQIADVAPVTAWIGALAYTFEIYYDFSGYSDMAIGMGQCFGFHFQENFNYPYMATSITEFWKRWHISLTDWFRDYVYIPLGGNRVSALRHVFNLFIVWLLTGIWHGAEWTFIIWGLIYFVVQLLEKKINIISKLPKLLGWVYTMFIVTICWVIFKAENSAEALKYVQCMFNFRGNLWDAEAITYVKNTLILFVIAFIFSFPVVKVFKELMKKNCISTIIYKIVDTVVVLVLLICSMLMVISDSYSPFIYFNF